MSRLKLAMFGLLLAAAPIVVPAAMAGDSDPLFVNAISDEGHRANMAFTFSMNQLERKHPVTIFLNDRAVFLGSVTQKAKFKEQQDLLAALMKSGATVLICPMCMAHYGIKEADLLPGIKIGNPEVTGKALFMDNTKTMTW